MSLLLALAAGLAIGSQALAQTGETASPPVTSWAVRIAPGSRCAENQAFANTVSAQIPNLNRATVENAELVAEVNLLESGLARVVVFDRVLQAEAGSRELQLNSRSCDDSAEAVALVLAVLVEAGRGALSVAPAPALPSPPPPPAPPAPAPLALPAPRRVEPRHLWLGPRAGNDLSASIGVSLGLLPSPALAGSLGWGIRSAKLWPVWLHVTGLRKGAEGEIGARFSAVYAGALGCPLHREWARLRTRACAGIAVGAMWAEPVGLRQKYAQDTHPLVVLGVELAGNLKLVGPLEATATFRVDGYPLRYDFAYDSQNGVISVHKPKAVSASLLAGLSLRFR